MADGLSIQQVKNLLSEGKSEAASEMLLNYVNTHHSNYYEAAILLKNRIESVQQQEIEGTISLSEKNIEWAKISKSVLGLALKIEKEESTQIEQLPNKNVFKPPIPLYLRSSKLLMSIAIFFLLAIFIYYLLSTKADQKTFRLDLQVDYEVKNSPNNELALRGQKLNVRINDFTKSDLILNGQGKAYVWDIPAKYFGNMPDIQLEDSLDFIVSDKEITTANFTETVTFKIKPKMTTYKGIVKKYDNIPVSNATIQFGSQNITVVTNENGEYSVELPNNIGESIVLSIIKDGKIIYNSRVMVNEQILYDIKVH